MGNHCDVLVVGGGCAGVAAALAAARAGAKTVLVERSTRLAGMGSKALVHTLCGLFHPDVAHGPRWLNPGIPTEIGEEVQRLTGHGPELMGRVYVLRHSPAQLAEITAQMCGAERLLTVRWRSEVEHISRHDDGHWQTALRSPDGHETLSAASLVDATGDALLAQWCAPELRSTAEGARLYRPAIVSRIVGVAEPLGHDTPLQLAGALVRAVQSGALPSAALSATFRQSPVSSADLFLTLDLEAGGAEWDPANAAVRARVHEDGIDLTMEIFFFLQKHHPLFASSTGLELPEHLGVRESSRWIGNHVLTGAEVLRSQRFPEEAALAGWPLEMRETARGPKFKYPERAEPAGIPLDSLRHRDVLGVYFAGRCLSCDHEALASIRVMGTCLATGQAAGLLASGSAAAGGGLPQCSADEGVGVPGPRE